MDKEAIEDMLETMLIGDSDQRKLRRLLIEHEREMQRLKIENDWLKKVLEDGEENRVDADGKGVAEQAAELSKLRSEVQELRKEKAGLADMLAQRIRAHVLTEGMRPRPCVKFKLNPISAWIAKLMEETAEAVHVAAEWAEDDDKTMEGNVIVPPEDLAEGLTDVITVCTSWLDALGYDEVKRAEIQGEVNDKNSRRGYC